MSFKVLLPAELETIQHIAGIKASQNPFDTTEWTEDFKPTIVHVDAQPERDNDPKEARLMVWLKGWLAPAGYKLMKRQDGRANDGLVINEQDKVFILYEAKAVNGDYHAQHALGQLLAYRAQYEAMAPEGWTVETHAVLNSRPSEFMVGLLKKFDVGIICKDEQGG